MNHRLGIRMLFIGVGAGIAAEFLWKLAEPEVGVPSLLRSGAWALAVLSGGLAWLLTEYGRDRRRALRPRLRQLRQIDGEAAEHPGAMRLAHSTVSIRRRSA